MKYQPPDEFNAIAYPEFSCLDTMFFADIGSYPEVEIDLVEEIEALIKRLCWSDRCARGAVAARQVNNRA